VVNGDIIFFVSEIKEAERRLRLKTNKGCFGEKRLKEYQEGYFQALNDFLKEFGLSEAEKKK